METLIMTDETKPPSKNWLERLGDLLQREPQDRKELMQLLRDAEGRHLLEAESLAMIEGVLQVSEMQARDIMVPRGQMVVIEHDDDIESIIKTINDTQHSRYPVIGESRDEVLGVLLAKDLLNYWFKQDKKFDIRRVLRPAVFIPESKRLNMLLNDFRRTHNHMAIVVDEYGGNSGLVTIEDVLEQIVGEIEDESDTDDTETHIKQISKKHYTIKALTPIEEFNEQMQAKFSDEEFDTIGGLVMNQFGHLPKRGETITLNRWRFKVLHADNRRIRLFKVTVLEPPKA